MKLSWYDVKPANNWDKVLASKWIWCLQYIEFLEKIGVKSYFNEPSGDICLFFRVVKENTIKIASDLKKRGKKIVYLLDVNYLARSGVSEWLNQVSDENIRNSHSFCEISNLVLCSPSYLVEEVQKHGYSSAYWPPGIDNRHFRAKKEINLSQPVLVWCGHAFKAELLDEIMSVVGSKLLIIAEREPGIGFPFRFEKWKYKKVPSYLVQADIGIAPRTVDNSYNKGHSFFKILIYLAAGLPVLAAPLPSYCDIIVDGKNGFICQNVDDFKRYSELLTPDMGRSAKESALTYDSAIMAKSLSQILEERL